MTEKRQELEASIGREASECSELLCANQFFDMTMLKVSEYPANFIPAGGRIVVGVDPAKPGSDCSVTGFYKDGVLHVQEIKCT